MRAFPESRAPGVTGPEEETSHNSFSTWGSTCRPSSPETGLRRSRTSWLRIRISWSMGFAASWAASLCPSALLCRTVARICASALIFLLPLALLAATTDCASVPIRAPLYRHTLIPSYEVSNGRHRHGGLTLQPSDRYGCADLTLQGEKGGVNIGMAALLYTLHDTFACPRHDTFACRRRRQAKVP